MIYKKMGFREEQWHIFAKSELFSQCMKQRDTENLCIADDVPPLNEICMECYSEILAKAGFYKGCAERLPK